MMNENALFLTSPAAQPLISLSRHQPNSQAVLGLGVRELTLGITWSIHSNLERLLKLKYMAFSFIMGINDIE